MCHGESGRPGRPNPRDQSPKYVQALQRDIVYQLVVTPLEKVE